MLISWGSADGRVSVQDVERFSVDVWRADDEREQSAVAPDSRGVVDEVSSKLKAIVQHKPRFLDDQDVDTMHGHECGEVNELTSVVHPSCIRKENRMGGGQRRRREVGGASRWNDGVSAERGQSIGQVNNLVVGSRGGRVARGGEQATRHARRKGEGETCRSV
eukprot:6472030-Amphidinium_carterae.3